METTISLLRAPPRSEREQPTSSVPLALCQTSDRQPLHLELEALQWRVYRARLRTHKHSILVGRVRRTIRCMRDTSTGAAGTPARGRRDEEGDPPPCWKKAYVPPPRKRTTTAVARSPLRGYPSAVPPGRCRKDFRRGCTVHCKLSACRQLARGVSSKNPSGVRTKRSGPQLRQRIRCRAR